MTTSIEEPTPAIVSNAIPDHIQERRSGVFLVLAGLFLGTLGMLNVLGISRFVNVFTWNDFAVTVAVGALP